MILRSTNGERKSTYYNISSLQTGKDTLLVNHQSQDGATGDHAVADTAVTLRIGTAGVIGDSGSERAIVGSPSLRLVLDLGRAARVDCIHGG